MFLPVRFWRMSSVFCFLCCYRKTKHMCFYGPELRQKANQGLHWHMSLRNTPSYPAHNARYPKPATKPDSFHPWLGPYTEATPKSSPGNYSGNHRLYNLFFTVTKIFREQHHWLCLVSSWFSGVTRMNRLAIILERCNRNLQPGCW